MLELREFLNQMKTSPEFRAAVHRAAITCGFDPTTGDENIAEELEQRITVLFGEILFELTDERFAGRTHMSRKTYDDDCRGPLCRKMERDRSRKRYQRGNPSSTRNRRKSALDDAVLTYAWKKYEEYTNNRDQLGGAA